MLKIPCEHDLLSSDPEIWANAVARCQGNFPYCGSDGQCDAGGDCFTTQHLTREQAIAEVDRLTQELLESKRQNNQLSQFGQNMIQELSVIRDRNRDKGLSERVFGLNYAITELKRILARN